MIHLNFFKANPHGQHLGHIIDAGRLAHSPIEFDNVNLIDEAHVHHHLNSNSAHLQAAPAYDATHVL